MTFYIDPFWLGAVTGGAFVMISIIALVITTSKRRQGK